MNQDEVFVTKNLTIPLREISLTAIRAQGAGGQHVNKTSSAIHLRFDIRASSLPERYKEALLALSHHLISKEGVVVIKSQEHRSLELNRLAALSRLTALVQAAGVVPKVRRASRPSKNARRKRTDEKVQRGQIKSLRGKIVF